MQRNILTIKGGEIVKRQQEVEIIVSELQKNEEIAKIDSDILQLAVERALKKLRSEKFDEKQKRRRY